MFKVCCFLLAKINNTILKKDHNSKKKSLNSPKNAFLISKDPIFELVNTNSDIKKQITIVCYYSEKMGQYTWL